MKNTIENKLTLKKCGRTFFSKHCDYAFYFMGFQDKTSGLKYIMIWETKLYSIKNLEYRYIFNNCN